MPTKINRKLLKAIQEAQRSPESHGGMTTPQYNRFKDIRTKEQATEEELRLLYTEVSYLVLRTKEFFCRCGRVSTEGPNTVKIDENGTKMVFKCRSCWKDSIIKKDGFLAGRGIFIEEIKL